MLHVDGKKTQTIGLHVFTLYSRYNTKSDWSYKNKITSPTLDVAAVDVAVDQPGKFQMKFVRGPSATSGLRTPNFVMMYGLPTIKTLDGTISRHKSIEN